MFKKKSLALILSAIVASALALALSACSSNGSEKAEQASEDGSKAAESAQVLKVGASPSPHAEILKAAIPELEKEGVKLEVVEFTDYIQPNVALSNKELDANYFQHKPYLDNYNKENKTDLEVVVPVHFEAMAVYGGKSKDLANVADGAQIAVPNDPTNEARALLLLQEQGLLKLKDGAGLEATPKDIVENPKNIKFVEVEAAAVPASLTSADFAVINGNYALGAGLNPKDALAVESVESEAGKTYSNYLVARPDNKDSESIQKLAKVLNSEAIAKFINDTYSGSVLPAF